MIYDLEGKIFTSLSNSENGDVDTQTLFYYHQEGTLVWAEYAGGSVIKGHLIATINEDGVLDMRYHHLNVSGELMIGKCISTPVVMEDNRLKFEEAWEWLSGDRSSGYSEIIELG